MNELCELSSGDEIYESFLSSRSTPRPKSVSLVIPAKNLAKFTGQAADSRNISVRDHTVIQASLIVAGGGDLHKVTLSKVVATNIVNQTAKKKQLK